MKIDDNDACLTIDVSGLSNYINLTDIYDKRPLFFDFIKDICAEKDGLGIKKFLIGQKWTTSFLHGLIKNSNLSKHSKLKNWLLTRIFADQDFDFNKKQNCNFPEGTKEKIKLLLDVGASLETDFCYTKLWNKEQLDSIYSSDSSRIDYSFCSPMALALSDSEKLSLLLRNKGNPDCKFNSEHSLLSYLLATANTQQTPLSHEKINILLYNGESLHKKINGLTIFEFIQKKKTTSKDIIALLEHGHARRVYRMAQYLKRCILGKETQRVDQPHLEAPELFFDIAQRLYGKLSSEDWEKINDYKIQDYKTDLESRKLRETARLSVL